MTLVTQDMFNMSNPKFHPVLPFFVRQREIFHVKELGTDFYQKISIFICKPTRQKLENLYYINPVR